MIIDTKLDLFKYGTPKVITKNLRRNKINIKISLK